MTTRKDLSVVIVSYNSWHYIRLCIESLRKHMVGVNYEVIVVDNASEDGSPVKIREFFPDIKLIENKENFGFAKANNQALPFATGEFVFLLNADTLILNNGIVDAMSFMRRNGVNVLGPELLDEDGSIQRSYSRHSSIGRYIFNIFSLATGLGRLTGNRDTAPAVPDMHVGFLLGAAMLIKREVIERLGLFDEQFFFTGEERDLCIRYLQEGERMAYFPAWKLIHYGGTGDPYSRFQIHHWICSSMLLVEKHGNSVQKLVTKIALFFYLWSFWIRFSLKAVLSDGEKAREVAGNFKSELKAYIGHVT